MAEQNPKILQKFSPIETEVGFIKGRDAICYPKLISINESSYCITGQLNGYNCSKIADKDTAADMTFSLTFNGVLWFKAQELDYFVWDNESCFDVIEHSAKLAVMRAQDKRAGGGKVDNGYNKEGKFGEVLHQHFVLTTYDTVYEIIAQSYDLALEKLKSSS